jgi:hypothetical protein
MRRLCAVGLALVAALASACSDPPQAPESPKSETKVLDDGRTTQWKLPKALTEISGLALSPDERLFAMADEQALVFELDYTAGGLVKIFAVGKPVLAGDFEGIAAADGELHLITSTGELISFAEGADGASVDYRVTNTGAGAHCEIEGLDHHPRFGFLIACKRMHAKAERSRVLVYAFRDGQLSTAFDLEEAPLANAAQAKNFHPSGIVAGEDRVVIVAAKQNALAEIGYDGTVLHVRTLDPDRHRQTEGIELTTDGRMLLGDEGAGKRARLSVFSK